jgi:hypothetical protein
MDSDPGGPKTCGSGGSGFGSGFGSGTLLFSYEFLTVSFVNIQIFILKIIVIFKLYDQIKQVRLDVELYCNALSK